MIEVMYWQRRLLHVINFKWYWVHYCKLQCTVKWTHKLTHHGEMKITKPWAWFLMAAFDTLTKLIIILFKWSAQCTFKRIASISSLTGS